MKRFFTLLAAGLFLLTACEPDPVLTLNPEDISFSAEGGSASVAVSANNTWNVLLENAEDFFTVSPLSGTGEGYITVTAKPNGSSSSRSAQIVVVCTSHDMSMTKTVKIEQTCPAGSIDFDNAECIPPLGEDDTFSAEGGSFIFEFTANGPWTASCNASDVKMDLTSGSAGSFKVTATIPACPVFEGRDILFTLVCRTSAGGVTEGLGFKQAGGIVTYGGETYHAVKMKDGKWWMSENLRYVPSGMTPSSDKGNVTAGVYYPLVYDKDNAAAAFSTDEAVIKAQGYLYQSEVALGLKVGDLTSEEQAKALEGTRGICPEGWHVPTKAEIVNLVGKSVGATTNAEAPYYDGANGSLVMLNADGFNIFSWGAVTIADMTKTSGTLMGALKGFEWLASGFYCGSSFAQVTYNAKDDPTSGVKNLMFTGFMPMTNKATEAEYTCNGSNLAVRTAASLRCVKD